MVNDQHRVLIVDDDAVSRMLLRHMLDRQGFDVVDADSVDTALVELAAADVDVIVCDYLMPERNGLDLLEALPADHAPFVLLTGELRQDDLDDPRVANVTTYLTKPIGTDELAITMNDIITQLDSSPTDTHTAAHTAAHTVTHTA